MSVYPVFRLGTLLLLVIPIAIAAAVLGIAFSRGVSVFKKQGVAWALTIVMVFAAIGIGCAKAPARNEPPPESGYPSPPSAASSVSFVWDNARVLSRTTVNELNERNEWLWDNYNVTVGVVTCDYGGDDLYSYAMQCAEDMGLGGYDMIVVLDIKGDNYWLLQGDDISRYFTDADCADYAYDYMEEWFAAGDYDFAVCQLTEMLELWYETYYG